MNKKAFLDMYARETSHGDKAWRSNIVPEGILRELLDEGFPAETLLLLKTVPLAILEILARDPDARVRRAVADKRAAAPLLDQLAEDDDIGVRVRVCYNAKVSARTLEKLARDASPDVRRAAQRPRF